MQIYSKSQIKSQKMLLLLHFSGRAKLGTLNFSTEFWDFAPLINYGNLCKFIPKITKIASSSFLDRFSLFVLSDRARWRLQNLYTQFWNSFIFFHVPSGASYLYFSHSNFFIFSPFPGHQMFIFWPVENCTTWNLRYLMLRDAGWALRHWRSCCSFRHRQWSHLPDQNFKSWG